MILMNVLTILDVKTLVGNKLLEPPVPLSLFLPPPESKHSNFIVKVQPK